jgi:hypothetical protein
MAKSNAPSFPLINTGTHASRVPRTQYKDAIGAVFAEGRYNTRIGNQIKIYDGRLAGVPVDGLPPFKKTKRSPHQLREIVKGVVLSDRRYMRATADEVFAAVAYQLLGGAWPHQKLVEMFAALPIARIQNAIRTMRNHDGDVECAHQAEWLERKRMSMPKTAAKAKKIVDDIHKTEWLGQARAASTMAGYADVRREKLTARLKKVAPEILVASHKNRVVVKALQGSDFDLVELTRP